MDAYKFANDLSTLHMIDKHAVYLIEEIHQESERNSSNFENGSDFEDSLSVLKSFIPMNNNSFKRDNLRTKLIRGHRKVLRIIIKHCKKYKYMVWKKFIPKKRFFRSRKEATNPNKSILYDSDIQDNSEINRWDHIAKIYSEDTQFFHSLSMTGYSLKPRCKEKDQADLWKSFNTEFCKSYFAKDITRRSFVAFLDLVFNNRTPDDYVQRFNAKCCPKSQHDQNCDIKWKKLRCLFSSLSFWLID